MLNDKHRQHRETPNTKIVHQLKLHSRVIELKSDMGKQIKTFLHQVLK